MVPDMEHDRGLQRLKATVQWYTAKRLKFYAEAEGLPVAVVASQLVRLGLDSLEWRDEDRRKLARWEYRENWNVARHIPKPGESKRVAVALEDYEIARVKEFAAGEFEDLSTGLNILIMYGFNSPYSSNRYWPKWQKFCRDFHAANRAA